MQIPLQRIDDPLLSSSGVNLFVLRLDQIHAHISGNKWYKLKYNIEEAKRRRVNAVLTFGGAYSNHIAATAAAGKEFGFNTIGIIRGNELGSRSPTPGRSAGQLNPTLQFAESCGMKLHFISREEYRKKELPEFREFLQKKFLHFYLLPEGGTNLLAVKGCAEILSHIDIPFDRICCAVGTGGTLAGIISALGKNHKATGFSVLKNGQFLEEKVSTLLNLTPSFEERPEWNINHDFHFGGYSKCTSELLKFIDRFEKQNHIPLEPVYTGKMMFGIYSLIQKGYFKPGETLVAVHTGGFREN